jgi:hypothetical protein
MRAYDLQKAAQYHDEIHAHVPSESALKVKALESLLVADLAALVTAPASAFGQGSFSRLRSAIRKAAMPAAAAASMR